METMQAAEAMLKQLDSVALSSLTQDGYPCIRQMSFEAHDGLRAFWFTSKRATDKVRQYRADPRAGVGFCVGDDGVSLLGRVEIVEDLERKRAIWPEKRFVEDENGPVYCLLHFVSERGKAYVDGGFTQLEFEGPGRETDELE